MPGGITADLMSKGSSIGFADTAITATAINTNAILVTNNVKHFDRLQELTVLNWDS
jgi:tRNA(fMet)-specific endonuclease VapC